MADLIDISGIASVKQWLTLYAFSGKIPEKTISENL
jgi:hypothetical protein